MSNRVRLRFSINYATNYKSKNIIFRLLVTLLFSLIN